MPLITSLDVLQEPFRTKVRGILSDAMERRTYFVVVETARDFARQEQLVAQGKSKTLKSKHLQGLAVDVAPVEVYDCEHYSLRVKEVSFWSGHPSWKVLAELAEKWGVTWGGNWETFKDYPHLEERQ